MDDSIWSWRTAWLAGIALIWLAWSGGIEVPFVYDDRVEVFPLRGRTLTEIHEWSQYHRSRPLVVISYLFDYGRAGGEADPRVFHWTSWWLHLFACGAGLFMVAGISRLSKRIHTFPIGMFVVLLWAIHPMVSESVLYISARSELLCGGFLFLSLGAMATALTVERKIGDASVIDRQEIDTWKLALFWRILSFTACAAAILSKETGLMGPIALAIMEIGLGGERDRVWWRRIRWQYWGPLFALILFGIGLRLQGLVEIGADETHPGMFSEMGEWAPLIPAEVDRDMGTQLTTSADVWRRYIGLWLMPVGQTIRHGQPDILPTSAGGLAAIGAWCLMMLGILWTWRRNRTSAVVFSLAALSLVPSTSFVPLNEHMAEHRSYQMGLFFLLGVGWSLPKGWSIRLRWVAPVLMIAALLASRERVSIWLDEAGIWLESEQRMMTEGGLDEAQPRSELATRAFQTGTVYRLNGRLREAEVELRRAIEHADVTDRVNLEDYEGTGEVGEYGLLYASWNELGIVLAESGDDSGAREAFEEAIRIDPRECRAQNNLGGLMFERRRTDFALRIYLDSLNYCPDDPVALFMLGLLHYESWKSAQRAGEPVAVQDRLRDQAQMFFERLDEVHPRHPEIGQVRDWLLELTFHQ